MIQVTWTSFLTAWRWFTPDKIVAIATVIYALVTIVMFIEIRSQAKAAQRQADIAERAARAAEKSAEVADQTLHLTQAADVHIHGVRFSPQAALTRNTVISIIIKNFGHTLAKKVAQNFVLGNPSEYTAQKVKANEVSAMLGAGQTIPVIFPPLFTKVTTNEQFGRILTGEVPLEFWGQITYYDVFGKFYTINCRGSFNPIDGDFIVLQYSPNGEQEQQSQPS